MSKTTPGATELVAYLLDSAEDQKSKLARTLHGDLGGLLTAIRMDLAELGKKVDLAAPGMPERWTRLQRALGECVALQQRIVEELRPALLDTLGLFPALRWHVEEAARMEGWKLECELPDEEVPVAAAARIALFRVWEAAITRIAKHARASRVVAGIKQDGQMLCMQIDDDGAGVSDCTSGKTQALELLGMRLRIEGIAGTFSVEPRPAGGTRIRVTVPSPRPPATPAAAC